MSYPIWSPRFNSRFSINTAGYMNFLYPCFYITTQLFNSNKLVDWRQKERYKQYSIPLTYVAYFPHLTRTIVLCLMDADCCCCVCVFSISVRNIWCLSSHLILISNYCECMFSNFTNLILTIVIKQHSYSYMWWTFPLSEIRPLVVSVTHNNNSISKNSIQFYQKNQKTLSIQHTIERDFVCAFLFVVVHTKKNLPSTKITHNKTSTTFSITISIWHINNIGWKIVAGGVEIRWKLFFYWNFCERYR